MKFFEKCKNLDELRQAYKEALKKHHPDNGGSEEMCKALNVEYKEAFDRLKNSRAKCEDPEQEKKESKKWSEEADEAIRNQIFNFVHCEGLNIEIIGCWVWIDGTTFPHRDKLKEHGFTWSRNRKKWHWTSEPATEFRRYKNKLGFDEIRSKYGSASVDTEKQILLA